MSEPERGGSTTYGREVLSGRFRECEQETVATLRGAHGSGGSLGESERGLDEAERVGWRATLHRWLTMPMCVTRSAQSADRCSVPDSRGNELGGRSM